MFRIVSAWPLGLQSVIGKSFDTALFNRLKIYPYFQQITLKSDASCLFLVVVEPL